MNELLQDAGRTWLAPPEADYDAMWSRIEREAFADRRPALRTPSWRTFSIGLAAALALGIGLGRFLSQPGPTDVRVASVDAPTPASGYDRVASELLGRTVLLLSALPTEVRNAGAGDRFATQAMELLTSTRLLLDSPAAQDVRMKSLLDDLELVLAQIAMLQSGRTNEEIDFITDALEERDVVPRIRSAAARLAAGD
jgi:hypothetical protein